MFNKFVPGCTWLIFEVQKYIQVQKYKVQVQVQPSVTYGIHIWLINRIQPWPDLEANNYDEAETDGPRRPDFDDSPVMMRKYKTNESIKQQPL
jgi:hypothetical protein